MHQILPIVVAGVALIAGALLSKRLATRYDTKRYWYVSAALLVAYLVYGQTASVWLSRQLVELTSIEILVAHYVSIALLTFGGGLLFGQLAAPSSRKDDGDES